MDDKIKEILDEIKNSKTELKNCIEASEANILLKIEDLKFRVNQLEEENLYLKTKIEKLERKDRENNIIVFGWSAPNENVTLDFISTELKNLVGVEVEKKDINNFYCLGKKANRPVKIEFISRLKKTEVIRNCKKLKGSSFAIANDLTEQQRSEYQELRKYLIQEKHNNRDCYIRGNKLIIDNKEYTLQDLQESEHHAVKSSSTPATPTQPLILHEQEDIEKRIQLQLPKNLKDILTTNQLYDTPKPVGTSRKEVKPEKNITRLRSNSQRVAK